MGNRLYALLPLLQTVAINIYSAYSLKTLDCYDVANRIGNVYGCPYLRNPANGRVSYKGKRAFFICDDGHKLIGSSKTTCSRDEWLDEVPICKPVCPRLPNPDNGVVEIVDGSRMSARYTCDLEFTLIGTHERLCDHDGVWTGSPPECIPNIIAEPGANMVAQVGENPRIGVSSGVYDILGPEVLIRHCNGTVTFNYRTTSSRVNLTFTASLLLVDNNGVVSSRSIVSTKVKLLQPKKATSEYKFVCLPLDCGKESDPSLVRVGRVRITIEVPNGIAEVTDIDFQDRSTCSGTVQDQQDCDSTTGSGDCGFRDTGCSTTSFEVTLTTGNDTDSLDKDDEVLIPLLKNTTSDTCHIFVCLPCLASSGYTVTEKLIPTPTPTEARVMKRRKRSTTQFHAVLPGKAFCLDPSGQSYAFAEQMHKTITKSAANKYISFRYKMKKDGMHELVTYVKCTGQSTLIQLAKDITPFKIAHYHKKGRSGTACLRLHKNIKHFEDAMGFSCTTFYVLFQGLAMDSKLCINNIVYLEKKGNTHACATVDNE